MFFRKILSFWDLRSALSRRAKATCRGWVLGTVLDGVAPQEKKEHPFFGARNRVSGPYSNGAVQIRSWVWSSLKGNYSGTEKVFQ